uniref:Fucoxanthin chlorophyll a/c protein 14 n=1 Tax=Chaetoceros neogracilis TaxID=240364 RepID=A0A6J4B499_9STRA|nr:Chain 14, Fucoxanthin chlorophyll a/c-binding protein Lhcq10 [Chaetoceros gracilis]6L4U_14 Chain 14, Fucoxanthin chlorophyll a/c-binding protein Lhcq10 [Chaetoceros gracilis]BBO94020.1 fucoxanthin chlorophyll a/c protein 14 [Chaetoceros gracilis]
MKIILSGLALLASSVAAFAPQSIISANANNKNANVVLEAAKDDLIAIAEKSNPVLKYYDPLQLGSTTIWGETNSATIGFLRQSEIKHGRIAMAAFVGYIVQANGIHFPWPMSFDGTPFPADAGSPPEQWDALSDAAKWQIILFIGFLEWFSEAAGKHYMRGGKPGAFPNFSDSDLIPHPVPLNLYDPFGFSKGKTEAQKADGLIKELNNGRLAMIGIMGFLAEQKVEGSVPLLKGVVPHYDGEVMAPFM